MIVLAATTSSLEIDLAGAITTSNLPVVSTFVDWDGTDYTPGATTTASNGTTAVTIVAAPAASTQRQVKLITVYNLDTVAATVTLQYNDNGTLRTLVKVALETGEHLVYTDGEGFRVLDAAGQLKQTITAAIADDSVTNAKLRNSGPLSVIGRAANSTGDPADISATAATDAVLRESGSTLGFGTVATAGIANDAITFAKMQNIATDRLVGRDTAASGDPEEVSVTNGLEFTGSTSIGMSSNQRIRTITFVIDGGGSAITTGIKGDLEIPFACTITRATLLADQSGSIVIDIWKDTYANYPPTDADSITSATPPTISSATKSQDATLSSWTTSIAAGDTLRFNVDSITTIQRVTLSLRVTVTG